MKCQHSSCQCAEATVDRNGSKYCSEQCARDANAAGSGRGCACGHKGCSGAA
jgi:hypothetical protein